MSDIEIMNTAVDANNWIKLNGVHFFPGYRKISSATPLHGQFDTSTSTYQIAKADKVGVENPVFTIRGVLSTDDYGASNTNLWTRTPSSATITDVSGGSMASVATLGYLMRLIFDISGQLYIRIYFGNPSATQYNWCKYDHSVPPVSDDYKIPVELIDWDPVPDVDSDGNHLVRFSLTFREVRV